MYDFPASPSVGQLYQDYVWDGLTWLKASSASGVVSALPAFRNRIINGDFAIHQRATASANTSGSYFADRWLLGFNAGVSPVALRDSLVPGTSLAGPWRGYIQAAVAKTTLVAADYAYLQQTIEGINISDLKWGTPEAKPVTLSFRATATGPRTYAVALRNGPGTPTRSYIVPFAVTSAIQTYSITIPGDTGGTWSTGVDVGIILAFVFASGSTYHTTSGAWQTGNFLAASGISNGFASTSEFLVLSDIQLEPGPVATPYEKLPVEIQLELCCRYYQTGSCNLDAYNIATGYCSYRHGFAHVMRINPVMTITPSINSNCGLPSADQINGNGFRYIHQVTASGTSGSAASFSAMADF